MENKMYAIYAYKFIEQNDEGDWTQGIEVKQADTSLAQDTLYGLFGHINSNFIVQNPEKDGTKEYICKVYGNDHRIVALRLQNDKDEYYWVDEIDPNDPMGQVVKKRVKSRPATFVIIDCRPGCNIIAIKVEKEAWRNTDNVRDIMENSINRHLENGSKGFRVRLTTKMYDRQFYIYSKYRIKKEGRTLKSMTITLKTGDLNPKIEALVNGNRYVKQLFKLIAKYSISGEIKLDKPTGDKLITRCRRDMETLIAIVGSNPLDYALDVTFDDNMTLHCGKDIRAELKMDPEGALELFHIGEKAKQEGELHLFDDSKNVDKSKYLLEGWLDYVAEEAKKMKDAEIVKRKRSRKNKKTA